MNQEKQFQFDTMKKILAMAEECERRAQELEEGIKKAIFFPVVEREIMKVPDTLRKLSQKNLSLLASMLRYVSEGKNSDFMRSMFETELADIEHAHQEMFDVVENFIEYWLN